MYLSLTSARGILQRGAFNGALSVTSRFASIILQYGRRIKLRVSFVGMTPPTIYMASFDVSWTVVN
jgi:hypothetical protein